MFRDSRDYVTGEVSEWSKVTDSKSVVVKATVGSNPTLSARKTQGFRAKRPEAFFVTETSLPSICLTNICALSKGTSINFPYDGFILHLQNEHFANFTARYSIQNRSILLYYKKARTKEAFVMSITATDLKLNLSKYLLLAETEDILITRNGKIVAKLSNPNADRVAMAESLVGVIPADITLEEARAARTSTI